MSRHDKTLKRFGQIVRHLRHEAGMSQEDLAAAAQLDRTYISGIERGVRNLALRNIKALAEALGVDVSDLTTGI